MTPHSFSQLTWYNGSFFVCANYRATAKQSNKKSYLYLVILSMATIAQLNQLHEKIKLYSELEEEKFRRKRIPTNGGDGGDDLSQLELVKDCGFTSCVETNHKDPHFLL